MTGLLIIFTSLTKEHINLSMRRNPIASLSFLAIMSLNNKGVPASETVTLVGGMADGGTVCNEGLSLEH